MKTSVATTKPEASSYAQKVLLNRLNALQGGYITLSGIIDASIGDLNSDLHCTVTVHSSKLFGMALSQGVLGIAEAYLQGFWDTQDLVTLIRVFSKNRHLLDKVNSHPLNQITQKAMRLWYWRSRNSKSGSARNIAAHYDLSNDFFKLWLDSKMMYSSAIFTDTANTLETASEQKLKNICQKLQLTDKDHVIEIGSGWGGFAIYAAENYGCKVTTTTISNAQFEEAQARIEEKGLSEKITLLSKDYRDLNGKFDKLVSIEMIEAVGHQYLDGYFKTCANLLKPNGLGLIQAITVEDTRYKKSLETIDYIKRYVFPGSFIPCNSVMIQSAAQAGLKLMGLEDIGLSYAKTLACWRENFLNERDAVKAQGFDERFIRLWDFYLCYCQGGFEEQVISNVHLVFQNTMNPTC